MFQLARVRQRHPDNGFRDMLHASLFIAKLGVTLAMFSTALPRMSPALAGRAVFPSGHGPPMHLLAKLLHILIAVVALGTSAGLGALLEFYGDHSTHGSFVLRAIERITALIVLPGYTLMLVTGIWLVNLVVVDHREVDPICIGAVGRRHLGFGLVTGTGAQAARGLLDSSGPTSASYRRVSVLGRAVGGSFGLIVVLIMCLMVFKPWS